MTDLIVKLEAAVAKKPKFGQPCNHCGYCCLAEVCVVGQEVTGQTIGPCKLLVQPEPGRYYCSLALGDNFHKETIGAGVGCCAKTQREVIDEINQK